MRQRRFQVSKIFYVILATCLILGFASLYKERAASQTPAPRESSDTASAATAPTPEPEMSRVSPVPVTSFDESKDSIVRGVDQGLSPLEIEAKTGVKVVTAREVSLDSEALEKLVIGKRNTVRLHLFEDADLSLDVNVTRTGFVKGVNLYGEVSGEPGSTASLVYTNGILVGTIVLKSKSYQVQYSGNRTHFVMEVDRSRFPKTTEVDAHSPPMTPDHPVAIAAAEVPTSGGGSTSQASAPVAAAAGDVVKLLVVYTPEASQNAGGDAAISAEIQNEVNVLNQSLANSGVAGTVELVATARTSYSQDPVSQNFDLNRISDGGDGFADDAAVLRRTYAADLVLLYTATFTNSCGVAYIGNGDIYHSVRYGYGVEARNCNVKLAMQHEIGHLFGADHDPANAGTFSASYAKGFVGPSSLPIQNQDIMAYDSLCFNCQRQRLFSNPNSIVNGNPVGSPTQDNARRIGETFTNITKNSDWPGIIPGAAFRAPGSSVTLTADNPIGVTVLSKKWRMWSAALNMWIDVPGPQTGQSITVTTPAEGGFDDYYVEFNTDQGYRYTWNARVEGRTYTNFTVSSWNNSTLTVNEGVSTTASISIDAPSAPVTYEWSIDGAVVSGQTGPRLSFTPIRGQMQLKVIVSNSSGRLTFTRPLNVQFAPQITVQPISMTAGENGLAYMNINYVGNPASSIRWQKDGVDIPGATFVNIDINPVLISSAGSYRAIVTNAVGSVASNSATLTVTPAKPVITQQPMGVSVLVGANLALSVTASSSTAMTYQWQFNGANMPGATSSTLPLSNIQLSQAGTYRVLVSNSGGTTTSLGANVTVRQAPAITGQPASRAVALGNSVTFTVIATGSPAPTYQWRFNGSPIAGGTNSVLSLNNVTSSQAGAYSVVVTNPVSSVTSNDATLTVVVPPTITQQPLPVTVNEGSPATFSVTASGSPPITYQWSRNGTPIAGATAATYSIAATNRNQSGTYTVAVTNAASTVMSSGAALDVLFAPTYSSQPMAVAVQAGETTSLTVTLTANPAATYKWFWINPITGATSEVTGQTATTLRLTNVTFSQRGEYFLRATNSVSSVDSQKALLNVGAIDRAPASTAGFMDKPNVKVDRTGGF